MKFGIAGRSRLAALLEQTRRISVGFKAQMREGFRGRDAPARGALDEALLQQIRLVDVLECVLLLGDDDCEGAQPDRATVELLADGAQDLAVEAVQALL